MRIAKTLGVNVSDLLAVPAATCLEDGQELDDVEDLVREICSFVMGIRDEIPQDIDYSLPKLPF